jgi:hypothetical protein
MASPANPDAEIIALSAEKCLRAEKAPALAEARWLPFEEEYYAIMDDGNVGDNSHLWRTTEGIKKALAFARESGMDDAAKDQADVNAVADRLFNRMMAIAATTQPGRAAKVRTLLVHVMGDEWRGDRKDLDWPAEMARKLLGEFAGLNAEELAAI